MFTACKFGYQPSEMCSLCELDSQCFNLPIYPVNIPSSAFTTALITFECWFPSVLTVEHCFS